jgi:hypothetical protein
MDILERLQNRLDATAIVQLREEIASLAGRVEKLEAENQRLYNRAVDAEEWAEQWREDFMALQLSAYPDGSPGITQSGRLVVLRG